MAHEHAGYVSMSFSVLFAPYFLIRFATALHEQQARLLLQVCIRNQQVVGISGLTLTKIMVKCIYNKQVLGDG